MFTAVEILTAMFICLLAVTLLVGTLTSRQEASGGGRRAVGVRVQRPAPGPKKPFKAHRPSSRPSAPSRAPRGETAPYCGALS